MEVTIYLITDPKIPGRVFGSLWPPNTERLKALRAQGCQLYSVSTHLPDVEVDLTLTAPALPVRYLGRTVRSLAIPLADIGRFDTAKRELRLGKVTKESPSEIVVDWSDSKGTFSPIGFERALTRGALVLEDDDDNQATDPSPTDP